MLIQDVIVKMPQPLYQRFQQVAHATQQPLDDVILRAMEVGSPPSWEEAPPEFQADLAALDRLDDNALWRIARSSQLTEDTTRYQELLDKKANGQLTPTERIELSQLRKAADRFLLRKAYAVDLLRWRGHAIPPAHQLTPLP
ncbi:MAG: hypothetical protein DYG89_03250 [Caldilinea sp. CFX5]|nr:hypothetical protein [Caldilinea sp. CFX5]